MPQIGDYYTGNNDIPSEQEDARRIERQRYEEWKASPTRMSFEQWCQPDEDGETVGMTQTDEPEPITRRVESIAQIQRHFAERGLGKLMLPETIRHRKENA